MKRIIILAILPLFWAFMSDDKPTVFLMGDSTVASKLNKKYPETGWGYALPIYADSSLINFQNHAKNGRSTKSFIDEGRWDSLIGLVKKGDFVFIEFGHNDEKEHKPKVYAKAETTYKNNLEMFVKNIKKKGATPILMTSIVRRHFTETGLLEYTHGKYPAVVKQVAEEQDVMVFDMEAKTKLLVERYGIEGSKELYNHLKPGEHKNYPDGVEDNTHLSRKGAVVVAAVVVDLIKEKMPELTKYF